MAVVRQRRKRSSVGTSELHPILRGCDGLHGGMHPTVVSCSVEHSTSRAPLVSGDAWRLQRVQGGAAGGGQELQGNRRVVRELKGSIRVCRS